MKSMQIMRNVDNMEVLRTCIEGAIIIEPCLFKDGRGYFFESFNQREFEEKVCKTTFVQDNESKSSYGVIRGLHFQKPPFAQSKLVRIVKGAVLDVAVDIREGSPTFGAACCCGTNRRKSSSIFYSKRLCAWIFCFEQRGYFSI